jgi:hypothetical protein
LTPQNLEDSQPECFIHTREGLKRLGQLARQPWISDRVPRPLKDYHKLRQIACGMPGSVFISVSVSAVRKYRGKLVDRFFSATEWRARNKEVS